jgi:hypothetical protein
MADLTTLTNVKEYLAIDPGETSVDALLARLVSSESARFSNLSNNPITSASYTETVDGNGTRYYVPKNYPVLSVTSVTVDGNAIPARASVSDNGFALVQNRVELVGYMFTSSRAAIYYSVYPSFSVSAGVGNVTIVYTAGYQTVPADVDQAVCEMVALKFRGRDRVGLMSQSVGGETLSYQTLTLPESVQSVIDNYSRPRI